jgi:hypothetical protein
MAHEFLIASAHSEAERYINSGSPKEVVSSQPAGKASRAHKRLAATNGGLYISRYFSHAIHIDGRRIRAGLERAGNAGQFQSQQESNSGRKSKYSQEENGIGNGSNFRVWSRRFYRPHTIA